MDDHRTGLRAPFLGVCVLVVLLAGTLLVTVGMARPASAQQYGQGPLDAVRAAAAANASCGLTADQLAAIMMTPTYPETGGTVPSPMTLSRYDDNAALYAFGTRSTPYIRAFWSPGVGMWQFDSAGGWNLTAASAIDAVSSAQQAASTIAYRWCNAPSSKTVDAPTRRQYAWGPWYACAVGTTCESIYNSLLVNGTLTASAVAGVDRYGGMVQRSCDVAGLGTGLTCWYVDPARAQGSNGWTQWPYVAGSGSTPLTAPFYDIEANGREYRYWISADTGYDADVVASKPVTADARTSLSWSKGALLCDVTTARGSCGAQARVATTPWGQFAGNPIGNLDAVSAALDGSVTVAGWSIDPDTNDPVTVHLYVDGVWGGQFVADVSRPDVAAAVPGYGDQHGFAFTVGVAPGQHQICLYAINLGPTGTTNPLLGCRQVSIQGNPFGSLDSVTPGLGSIVASGWAIDPDTTGPVTVTLTVDGAAAGQTVASLSRPDVGEAFPRAGAAHGFQVAVSARPGSHQLCAVALNQGPNGNANTPIGCGSVTVSGSPFGSFDLAAAGPGGVFVGGWAIDPSGAAVTAQVTVDGVVAGTLTTGQARPDVAAVFPGRGDSSGFSGTIAASPGGHQVCVSLLDQSAGGTPRLLRCAAVTVWSGNPFGNLDGASRTGDVVTLTGWAIDPDTASPVTVHVYVDGAWGGAFVASTPRPDVGAAYPGFGALHGLSASVPVPAGAPATVCAYTINQGPGTTNPLLGCRVL